MKKLNIGCGADIKKGYINLDYIKQPGVDVVYDINKFPWPFKDNTFDKIFCSHTLEHVESVEKVMKEIWRISKPGANIVIRVPHFSCGVYYRDISHRRPFSYFTMDYFANESIDYKRKDSSLFKIVKRKINFTRLSFTFLNYIFNPLINLSPSFYERFFCWIFPASEVIYVLETLK